MSSDQVSSIETKTKIKLAEISAKIDQLVADECKELTFEEMNHINFDWYMPSNASRHSIQEILKWCEESNLIVEKQVVENAGITIIAKKNG